MKLNRKGFTLIELLAVIAILAVIMLIGGQSVFGTLEKAKKGAFKTEVGYAIQAAQSAYQVDLLNQKVEGDSICYSIQGLISNDYYQKDGGTADQYKGSVLVTTTPGSGKATYTIWMQSDKYIVENGTIDNLDTEATSGNGAIIAKSADKEATATCGGSGKVRWT